MAETEPTKPLTVEPIHEGYLVKGTTDPDEAREALPQKDEDLTAHTAGWLRKVPGQWSAWVLKDATPGSRGAFPGVVFWRPSAY